jgi:hypothetical protein
MIEKPECPLFNVLHRAPIRFQSEIIANEPTQESKWLRRRLKEAKDAWGELVPEWVIVVVREPLGALISDDEIAASQKRVPPWITEVFDPHSGR